MGGNSYGSGRGGYSNMNNGYGSSTGYSNGNRGGYGGGSSAGGAP